MGLVEACDAHQVGFNVESRFYLNPQEYVNIILSRRCAAALWQPVGRTSTTPIERPSTHPDRCLVAVIEFLQPAPEKD
jgi:hypothetical protein